MDKPTQYEIDTCREVLEYMVADISENEPFAVNTLNDIEAVLGALPNDPDDLGEVD